MKSYLLFALLIAFSVTASAQIASPIKTSNLKEKGSELTSNQQDQIKTALMKDESLQAETIEHLKTNPDTKSSLMSMATDNVGSSSGLMKSILGDKNLTSAAIEYVSSNPDLLSKAMKVAGM